jgi:hypothetical protein
MQMRCQRAKGIIPRRSSEITGIAVDSSPTNANAMSKYGQGRHRLFALVFDAWGIRERIRNGCHCVFDDMRDAQHSWLVEVLAKNLDADG